MPAPRQRDVDWNTTGTPVEPSLARTAQMSAEDIVAADALSADTANRWM